MNEVKFITIPVNEWEGLKSDLKFIATEILSIKQKNSKEYLTIKEVCNKLKCSRNTLQKYMDMGKIEPLEINRNIYKKVLFRSADIEYFLQNNTA